MSNLKLKTRPLLPPDLTPLVEFKMGKETAKLTAKQAEDIGESLVRAATASRYEAAIAEVLQSENLHWTDASDFIGKVRQAIENLRVRQN